MNPPRINFKDVAIEAVAYELPPRSVTSAQLEERLKAVLTRLKLPLRPIEALTGIVERRFWEAGTEVHQVATRVARRALEAAEVPAHRIGVLINTSVSKDYLEPSMASLVHGDLGLESGCTNFDIANACLGFLNGIEVAGRMIESGAVDYALIVDGESSGPIVDATIQRLSRPEATAKDFWDNFATFTLGSGAVAMVLCHARLSRTTHRVNGSVTLADTSQNRLCLGTAERMVTASTILLKAGVELALRTWGLAAVRIGRWSVDQIDQFICHQVGRAHTVALAEALGIDMAKCFPSYPQHGNVGPAAVPLTLALAHEAGRIRPGDHVALMGIGSGLNVSMMSVTW
jgi:3-oxoacyl-[acyl-carrier-protein] synthase III